MSDIFKKDGYINYNQEKYIYIHRSNRQNIIDSGESIINSFINQREEFYNITKERYMKNYLQSINFVYDPEGFEYILSTSESELKKLDDELIKKFNNIMSENNIRGGSVNALRTATLEESLEIIKGDFYKIDNILESVNNAISLFQTIQNAPTFVQVLQGLGITSKTNIKDFSTAYSQNLDSIKQQIVSVNKSEVDNIVSNLKNLLNNIASGKEKSLKNSITGMFTHGFGELLTINPLFHYLGMGTKEVTDAVTGMKGTNVQLDAEAQALIDKYGNKGNSGKTDISLKNIQIKLSSNLNDSYGIVGLQLGLSIKNYLGAIKKKPVKKGSNLKGKVAFLEDNFIAKLDNMINENQKYTVYNYLVHKGSNRTKIMKQFRNAMILRSLDQMLGGLGINTGDFSQFIVINEEFYSILSILQDAKKLINDDKEAVIKSRIEGGIDKIKEIDGEGSDAIEMFNRVKQQNISLNKLKLRGELSVSKLHYLI